MYTHMERICDINRWRDSIFFVRKMMVLSNSFSFHEMSLPLFRCWSVTTLFVCWWKPGTYMSRKNISCTLWDLILVPPCFCSFFEGDLSPIHVARLICVSHNSHVSMYIIFSNLFLIGFWFLVFLFWPLICFSVAEECTCIIILLSIYLPMQTPIYRPIFLFP